jgi:hypothetical protein
MIKKLFPISIVLITSFLHADAAPEPDLSPIQEKNLKAHAKFLSHDLLEGRGTATRGYDLAALYVATQFEQLGVKPGGKDGNYFQPVPFRKANIVPGECSFTILGKNQRELKYGVDYLMSADYLRENSALTADVVFAGYGITATDLKYDDYAGIDVKGKIVALISSAPDFFPISERAHFASGATKQANAVAHGAVGIINFQNPVDEQRSPWERSVRQNKLSGYRWIDSQNRPYDVPVQLQAWVSLSRAGAEALFQRSPVTLKQVDEMWSGKRIRSFPLNLQVSLKSRTTLERATSSNVIGVIPGSDPDLNTEYVVLTAHLDHIGISDPVKNDRINNGAYDNATGIACLIEMARAFVQQKVKPRRSILFVALTGEEKGLQGAYYFTDHPTVPIDSIVANVNTDMFLMVFPFADAVALGAEHSTMGPIARNAFERVGLKMSPDPAPEEVRFVRSDQYAFIKKGIPAIKLMAGFQSLDPKVNGAEITRNWLRTIYHTPQDEWGQKMHWESGIKIVQATFLIGYGAANQAGRPQWNTGDFFGRTFGRQN